MKEKLLIVTCTRAKTNEEFARRPIYQSLKKQYEINSNISFYVFKDNQRGLSDCYNEILSDSSNADKVVLFVHDDLVLEDLFLYEKLMQSPYSITGLAGTKTFDKRAEKLAWHLAAENKNSFVGEVGHYAQQHGVWTTQFGPTNSRALIVDGLFIACKINDIVAKQLQFDTNFGFHFYDIAFCLRANEKKVTCGVLPIRVIHHGLGDSMLTQEWEAANQKFKQLYP